MCAVVKICIYVHVCENKSKEEKKGKKLIQETFEARNDPRQVEKHKIKQIMRNMRKETGEITSDREGILRMCTDFYKSLYSRTVPTSESTMKSSPDTEEVPQFTEEVEVERAIKRMKRHKGHGMDGFQGIL